MRRRGFTLVEVVVVLAVLGIIIAMAIPALGRVRREQRLRGAQRQMLGNIRGLQHTIATATDLSTLGSGFGFGSGSGGGGGANNTRARFGGIIIGNTSYQTYADADDIPFSGNEITLKTVDFAFIGTSGAETEPLEIIAPAPGTTILLRSRGAPASGQTTVITLRDPVTGVVRNVEISIAGSVRLTP